MTTPVAFEQLDEMAAEILPDRTVLSVVVTPAGGGGAVAGGEAASATTTLSTCQTTTNYVEPGVLGLLGLGMNQTPVQAQVCTPSAVTA